jgi:ATP-dependent DNA helicase RecG
VLPPPAMSVQKYVFPEGELAVVEVQPSTLPPVRYKGRVHIRVGPRKGYANEQEERILSERRAALVTSFDAHPLREAGLADLTMRLFDEYRLQTIDSHVIEENHRTAQDKLASLRCFDLTAGVPTVAGILLFGNNPRYFLPGAYVQFLRFPGETMTDRPDDALVVSGDLRTVLDTVRQKIVAYNAISVQQGEGFRDKEAPDYPEWALRELFHNAVMHRDYQSSTPIRFYWFADRIEIQSPGGLYGEVTRETLERRNSYRNPVLAAMGFSALRSSCRTTATRLLTSRLTTRSFWSPSAGEPSEIHCLLQQQGRCRQDFTGVPPWVDVRLKGVAGAGGGPGPAGESLRDVSRR